MTNNAVAASWERCPVATNQCTENECRNGCSIMVHDPIAPKDHSMTSSNPSAMSAELVERLREADRGSVQRALGSRIFGEAADIIDGLLAERERLREALKPFAEKAEQVDRARHSRDSRSDGFTVAVSLGKCRKARAALAQPPASEKE